MHTVPPTYTIPQPNVIPSQPQPAQIRPNPLPTTQTVLKPNLPPERIAPPPKPNYQLQVAAASFELVADAYQAVQAEQQQKLEDIKTELGPEMCADPGVAAALQNVQDRIDNGEEITPADIAAVNNAIIDALNNGVPITGGGTEASVNQALGSLETLSQIQQILQVWPPDGAVIPFPGGLVDVIFDPFLPADAIYVLPGGGILDGTGGVGGFGMGQGTLAEAAGFTPGEGAPLTAASADASGCAYSGLLIMNPATTGGGMEYVINSQNYSTPAGYNQAFSGTGGWLAQFNRGPGFGDARYSLNPGTYYFASTDHGWELYVRTFTVIIDNADNPKPFEYIVGNTNSSVAAGQSQTHTSNYPICIRFDRGGGNQPAQKIISDPTQGKTQLRVAINTEDNLWDLYPAKNFDHATAPATATPSPSPGPAATAAPGTVKFEKAPVTKDGKLKFPPARTTTPKKWPVPEATKKAIPAAPVPLPPPTDAKP